MHRAAGRPARRLVVKVQAAAPDLHEHIARPAELAVKRDNAPKLLPPPRHGRIDIGCEEMHMMEMCGGRWVRAGGVAVRHAGSGALTSSTVLPSGSLT